MSTSIPTMIDAPSLHHYLLPFIFSLIIIFTTIISSRIFRRRKPYPPGPPGWPLIGNISLLPHLNHRGLAALARRYGGVLHLRVGLVHMVAVSTPDAARQVLQTHDHAFSNRPATAAIRYLTYDRADMAFANYGPFWRQMRKLCVVKLFSRRRAESWNSVRDETDRMIRLLAAAAAEADGSSTTTPANIGELVFGMTRNIIYRAAFGRRSSEEEGGQEEFIRIMQEFSMLFGAFNVADFVPPAAAPALLLLGWVDPQGVKRRAKQARAALDGFIDAIIDEHIRRKRRRRRKNGERGGEVEEGDMVDELLEFYKDEDNNDDDDDELLEKSEEDLQSGAIKLTRDNIKAIIMDVMFGGTETVASAIEWAMAELLRSPKDLERVQQELATVVGLGRKVEESDFEKLTYLRCCLKEVLRLHPPISLLLHETSKDSIISGYHIPEGSRVMINVWAIGRDESAWGDDADAFKPERFLREGAPDFKGSNFEFIPFGSGRRSCPGMQLGLYALEVAVAHLVHCFTWELPDGMKPGDMDMDDVFGLTAPRATRLTAVPRPRLLCPLYN